MNTRGQLKSQFRVDPINNYIVDHSLRLTPVQEKLVERTIQHKRNNLLGDPVEMQFLQMVIKMIGAKKTLDIGVFTGYSALCIGMALPDDGKIVACDVSDEYTSIGKPYWKEAGVDHKINLRIAPALDTLGSSPQSLVTVIFASHHRLINHLYAAVTMDDKLIQNGESGTFDFAFIDADKTNCMNYYERCLKLLRRGGIIAIDNTLFNGWVLDANTTDSETAAIRELNEILYKDERVEISFLRVGDGTTLCRVK